MEPSDEITTMENALRDLVETILAEKLGSAWLDLCGVSMERLSKWRSRREEERKRRAGVRTEDRLLYYSDLTDLQTILDKQWQHFASILGDKRVTQVYLDRLVDFRTALAHGRPLIDFERDLLGGICGELRNTITMYRSEKGPDKKFFPEIEFVRDSFGNEVRPPADTANTGLVLHPGEVVSFTCQAWDPEGEPPKWFVHVTAHGFWPNDEVAATFTWTITEANIADPIHVAVFLVSSRAYHRRGTWDGIAVFNYRVLPGP